MGWRLLVALGLAAVALAGCETYSGPTANCFSFTDGASGDHGCGFRPVAGAEGFEP